MVEVRGVVGRGPAQAVAAEPAGGRVVISDVWSRSGTKYRVRAVVLLVLNLLLFGALGCFAFWLRTGHYLAPALGEYWHQLWQTCLPGSGSRTLTSLLTFPINLEEVPLQIVIHGLLLSALVSIPILVSILYRFPYSLPFVAVVAFVAMMPWLALTLLGSCILASVKPFRFSFRYASALLGLVLVVIYIIGVSLQNLPAAAVLANPGHRVTLVAPWILAVLAACVLLALGLGLAKAVNYRPGAIAPLLATMFALPIALFEQYVGRDELYFSLLEYRYGPRSTYFQDREVQGALDRGVERPRELEKPDQPYEALAGLEELRWPMQLEAPPDQRTLFASYQEQAARDCDEFIRYFPDSRYAPAVLYLKGRALDMRVDLEPLRERKKPVFYDTYPALASRQTWRRLLANAPESPFAAVASYRLAALEARGGNLDGAMDLLRQLRRFDKPGVTTLPSSPPSGLKGLLQTTPPESGLQVPLDSVVFEGKRLLGILENNRDPLYGDDPLTGPRSGATFPRLGWMLFDPQSAHYRQNLSELLARYPKCQLTDNIEVELARTLPEADARAAALKQCVEQYMQQSGAARAFRDALPEAWYRLGEAYVTANQPAEARRAFERLNSEYPESIWRGKGDRRLATLGPTTPVKP
ncbi:MAG: tetratricopeptide repeat protein [Planctomycetota bacterium]